MKKSLIKLKTAEQWGRAYAEWSVKHDNYTDGPIDYEKSYPTIPDGDYKQMKMHNVDTNDRKYWNGFNSFFE